MVVSANGGLVFNAAADDMAAMDRAAVNHRDHAVNWTLALGLVEDHQIVEAGIRSLLTKRPELSGEKGRRVAHLTGLAGPTVKEYIDRIRAKYARVGRPAPTKVDLYRRAVEDGVLPGPRALR